VNPRRFNDIGKVIGGIATGIGSIGAALLMLAGMLPAGKLAATLVLIGTAGAGFAGWATRAFGTEYQDVADAKAIAKASMMPPPMPTQAPPPVPPAA
jgi:hypothetical protein